MRRNDGLEHELPPAVAGLVEVSRRTLGRMSDTGRVAGLRALRARLWARRDAQWRVRPAVWAGVAMLSCVLGVFALERSRQRAAPLMLRVDGKELRAGASVEASSLVRPVLHFSDGSEVTLSERSRLHVRAIDEHGARVTLDEGQAHVYVVHAPGTRWSFDAGPFVVAVTGTAFGISWDPNERRLDVRLENGSVTVSGPTSDAPISLRAGQWLIERPNEVFIRSADDSEAYAADDAGNPALDAPDAGPNGREAPPQVVDVPAAPPDRSARHAASKADHRWRRALANGQFETIIADAERRGVEVTLANGSAEDLTALADAARYTRRPALARKALFALRQRFPGAAEAHLAAFSLGRLAESEGDRRNAQSWLETYLAEAPEGTYAAEALGRKMEIVRQGEGNAAARPVAEDYIRRFPDSPYSEAARSILARP